MKPPEIDSEALREFKAASPDLDVRRFITSRGQPLDERQLFDDERAVWIPEADGWAVVRSPER